MSKSCREKFRSHSNPQGIELCKRCYNSSDSYRVGFLLVSLLVTIILYNRCYAITFENGLFDDLGLFPPQEISPGSQKSQIFQMYYLSSDCTDGQWNKDKHPFFGLQDTECFLVVECFTSYYTTRSREVLLQS